jgi:hypothetical protein
VLQSGPGLSGNTDGILQELLECMLLIVHSRQ